MSDVAEKNRPLQAIIAIGIAAVLFVVFAWSFNFMRNGEAPKFLIAVVALIDGVGGIWALYSDG
jgi:alpha-glucoside transport system permease protein